MAHGRNSTKVYSIYRIRRSNTEISIYRGAYHGQRNKSDLAAKIDFVRATIDGMMDEHLVTGVSRWLLLTSEAADNGQTACLQEEPVLSAILRKFRSSLLSITRDRRSLATAGVDAVAQHCSCKSATCQSKSTVFVSVTDGMDNKPRNRIIEALCVLIPDIGV